MNKHQKQHGTHRKKLLSSKKLKPRPLERKRRSECDSDGESTYEIAIGPVNRRSAKRLVEFRHKNGKQHRDHINLDDNLARKHFVRDAAALGDLNEQEAKELDQRLLRKADEVDSQTNEGMATGSTAEDTTSRQVRELLATAEFFRTPDNQAFARVLVDGHYDNLAIESAAFRRWIKRSFFALHRKNLSERVIKDIVALAAAIAATEQSVRRVGLRVMEEKGNFYLDLGRADRRAVKISGHKLTIVSNPRVPFDNSREIGELPVPNFDGTVQPLFRLFNIDDEESQILLTGLLVAILNLSGTKPILVLRGPRGSAKTTLMRALKRLIDPTRLLSRSLPRKEQDLWIAVERNWVLAFDNVRSIPDWLSDSLCQIASGGGLGMRKLYTDDEEVVLEGRRPVILNGIAEVVQRTDLIQRSIVLEIDPMPSEKRRTEDDVEKDFIDAWPGVLGALLKGVQAALQNRSKVNPQALPRLADFVAFAMSAMPAFGWKPEQFLQAFQKNQQATMQNACDDNPVFMLLLEFAKARKDELPLKLTPQQLLDELKRFAKRRPNRSHISPLANTVSLGKELREITPELADAGLTVKKKKSGNWTYTISYTDRDESASKTASRLV